MAVYSVPCTRLERRVPLVAAAREFNPEHVRSPFVDNVAVLDPSPVIARSNDAFEWRLTATTADSSAVFLCGAPTQINGIDQIFHKASPGCTLPHLDRIVFSVTRALGSPIVATFELRQTAAPQALLARFRVQLASSSATASLPIPLWLVTNATCFVSRLWRDPEKNETWVGQPLVIDHHAIAEHSCRITLDYQFDHLDPSDQATNAAARPAWEQLVARGSLQSVAITVTHGTATATSTYVVDPAKPHELPVPTPSSDTDSDADYIVNVKLTSANGVTYLESTLDETITTDPNTNVSFTLHPRGIGSTSYPFRLGVTFPLTPFSLRFPPRADEVTRSSSSTRVAIESQRVSAVVFLDYWDYAHEQNKFAIPFEHARWASATARSTPARSAATMKRDVGRARPFGSQLQPFCHNDVSATGSFDMAALTGKRSAKHRDRVAKGSRYLVRHKRCRICVAQWSQRPSDSIGPCQLQQLAAWYGVSEPTQLSFGSKVHLLEDLGEMVCRSAGLVYRRVRLARR